MCIRDSIYRGQESLFKPDTSDQFTVAEVDGEDIKCIHLVDTKGLFLSLIHIFNPLTGETVKVTAVEQTEFVDSKAVRNVTIPDEIVTLRESWEFLSFRNLHQLRSSVVKAM